MEGGKDRRGWLVEPFVFYLRVSPPKSGWKKGGKGLGNWRAVDSEGLGRSVGWLAGWLALICTAPSRPACRLFLVRSLPLASSSSSFTSALASTTSASFPFSSFSLHYHQCRAHATRREREREGKAVKPAGASQPASQPPASLHSTIYHRSFHHALFSSHRLLSSFTLGPRAEPTPRTTLKGASLSALLPLRFCDSELLFCFTRSPPEKYILPRAVITVLVSQFLSSSFIRM